MADYIDRLPTRPYKGTRDFLPETMSVRTKIFDTMFATVEAYGFERYDGPVLEPAAIYEAKSGEEVAREQLFRLTDRAGRELALRPEMTPSVARLIAANAGQMPFPARWYSHVLCYRYERPQRGRTREHWQLNVDIFGSASPEAEIEIFDLIGSLMQALRAPSDVYRVRVNDRNLVTAALRNRVEVREDLLAAVLTVIDQWEKVAQDKRNDRLWGLGLSSAQIDKLAALNRSGLGDYCEAAGDAAVASSAIADIIPNRRSATDLVFDPLIVRGLAYYTGTVFEVFDVSPENRRSLFGGGRYDDLAALFTDKRIPGIGFAVGDVTTWDFLEVHGLLPEATPGALAYVFCTDEQLADQARVLARNLREQGISVTRQLDPASMSKGLRSAAGSGARVCVVVDGREMERGRILVKNLLTSVQSTPMLEEAAGDVARQLASVNAV